MSCTGPTRDPLRTRLGLALAPEATSRLSVACKRNHQGLAERLGCIHVGSQNAADSSPTNSIIWHDCARARHCHLSHNSNVTMTKENPPSPFEVPTIDIAPFISAPSSSAANDVIGKIRKACLTTGFFQIIGHGIPRNLQRSIFDASEGFFSLPYEDKKKLDASSTIGHRGYDVLASQSYAKGIPPDLKEVN